MRLIIASLEVAAYILILAGGAISVLAFLAGGLGHTYPVPIAGLSAVFVGSLFLWFLKYVKNEE